MPPPYFYCFPWTRRIYYRICFDLDIWNIYNEWEVVKNGGLYGKNMDS